MNNRGHNPTVEAFATLGVVIGSVISLVGFVFFIGASTRREAIYGDLGVQIVRSPDQYGAILGVLGIIVGAIIIAVSLIARKVL